MEAKSFYALTVRQDHQILVDSGRVNGWLSVRLDASE
jgi:hypothetical protein